MWRQTFYFTKTKIYFYNNGRLRKTYPKNEQKFHLTVKIVQFRTRFENN